MSLTRLCMFALSVCFAATIPASGADAPQKDSLELFDQAMRTFMTERHIGAGTLAVSRDGKLLLSRAYGFADEAHHRAVQPDDPFRLASATKPFTAAIVRHLIADGKLSLDTQVFPLLGFEPFPGHTADPRLEQITVGELLQHKGGWDREASFDPMFRPLEIARVAGTPPPANQPEIVRYMIGMPLQFNPGSKAVYSNFGYCVLGRVIEKVTGRKYTDALKEMILDPLDIHTVELGRTLPRLRNLREPIYIDPGRDRNVTEPQSDKPVPAPDGGFNLEAMDSHGGLIGSAPDLCKFLDAYWISGIPRNKPRGQTWLFNGSLPGTFTMVLQTPNGYNIAALFNQRTDPSGLGYEKINEMMKEAAKQQNAE